MFCWLLALALAPIPGVLADSLPPTLVIVHFQSDGSRQAWGNGSLDREAVANVVLDALRDRGATVLAYSADSAVATGAARASEFAACHAASGAGSEVCVRVALRLSHARAGGRQTVSVSLRAELSPGGRPLHSASGRAGPYAMDVPLQRLAERAVENLATEFVDGLLTALPRANSG